MPTNDIACPHCGKSFTLDEAGYADILKQVRDEEFASTIQERMDTFELQKRQKLRWPRPPFPSTFRPKRPRRTLR